MSRPKAAKAASAVLRGDPQEPPDYDDGSPASSDTPEPAYGQHIVDMWRQRAVYWQACCEELLARHRHDDHGAMDAFARAQQARTALAMAGCDP